MEEQEINQKEAPKNTNWKQANRLNLPQRDFLQAEYKIKSGSFIGVTPEPQKKEVDPKQWKDLYSIEDREQLIFQIFSSLKGAAEGKVSIEESERLYEASKAFENAVFEKAETMEQYAGYISDKVERISKTSHGEHLPQRAIKLNFIPANVVVASKLNSN